MLLYRRGLFDWLFGEDSTTTSSEPPAPTKTKKPHTHSDKAAPSPTDADTTDSPSAALVTGSSTRSSSLRTVSPTTFTTATITSAATLSSTDTSLPTGTSVPVAAGSSGAAPKGSLSAPAIAGIAVAIAFGIFALITICFFVRRHAKQSREAQQYHINQRVQALERSEMRTEVFGQRGNPNMSTI